MGIGQTVRRGSHKPEYWVQLPDPHPKGSVRLVEEAVSKTVGLQGLRGSIPLLPAKIMGHSLTVKQRSDTPPMWVQLPLTRPALFKKGESDIGESTRLLIE